MRHSSLQSSTLALLFLASWGWAACDGPVDVASEPLSGADADGDGYDATEDCDDNNHAVHPGANEVCDGVDNDCDALTAERGMVARVKDGVTTDATGMFTSGSAKSPATIHLEDETLTVCAGTYHVNLTASGDTTIRGMSTTLDTVLSGGLAAPVVSVSVHADVTIDELTLTQGHGAPTEHTEQDAGGGVLCAGDASLYLSDVSLTRNVATQGAGVAVLAGCTALIERTEITQNAARVGGGLYVANVELTELASVQITHNTAHAGAGVYVTDGATLHAGRSWLNDNVSTGAGGAAWVGDARLAMEETDVFDNTALDGAGLYVRHGGEVEFSDGTMLDNRASGRGGALFIDRDASVDIELVELEHNVAAAGGAAYLAGGDLVMRDGSVVGNQARAESGGWHLESGATCEARRVRFEQNQPFDLLAYGLAVRAGDGERSFTCDGVAWR